MLSLGFKLQYYVVRETTQIYKTMISLDSHISFASTNIKETMRKSCCGIALRLHCTLFCSFYALSGHPTRKYHYFQCNGKWTVSSKLEALQTCNTITYEKISYKDTLCCFMHVNKAIPLMKMAYFKPKRHLFTSL